MRASRYPVHSGVRPPFSATSGGAPPSLRTIFWFWVPPRLCRIAVFLIQTIVSLASVKPPDRQLRMGDDIEETGRLLEDDATPFEVEPGELFSLCADSSASGV